MIGAFHHCHLGIASNPLQLEIQIMYTTDAHGRIGFAANEEDGHSHFFHVLHERPNACGTAEAVESNQRSYGDLPASWALAGEVVGVVTQTVSEVHHTGGVVAHEREEAEKAAASHDGLRGERKVDGAEEGDVAGTGGGGDENKTVHGVGVDFRVLVRDVATDGVAHEREVVDVECLEACGEGVDVPPHRVVGGATLEAGAVRAPPAQQVDRVHAVAQRHQVVEVAEVERGRHRVAVQHDDLARILLVAHHQRVQGVRARLHPAPPHRRHRLRQQRVLDAREHLRRRGPHEAQQEALRLQEEARLRDGPQRRQRDFHDAQHHGRAALPSQVALVRVGTRARRAHEMGQARSACEQ